ncbi:hypothetical protein [Nonomuraea guangzhouensis]|uniref:Lipoprotein n=1 Tax=Nonomuraea guangzhouensis TaxID=1291555 RepID=A0ABW4GFH5_9ACTN|nr:hypothetical protein [Nonomuraea guangzhouensis]
MTPSKIRIALAVIATAVSLTACTSTTAQTTSAGVSTSSASASAQAGKVSANTADEAQITAALQVAGVTNPDRWAREVMEYRPYAADDTDLTSLRQNLAKYNPGQDTVDKIVSALTP